ncbi:MAG: (2Fe-2S)-binding protein [Parvularculaceae bacterium]|nr:(2Fe-2S)-binding protein [Parvularculaceae bacterium]
MRGKRVDGASGRGKPIEVRLNGQPVEAYEGETVLALLILHGERAGAPERGPFCNMGVCHDCLVTLSHSDQAHPREARACLTAATDGMSVFIGPGGRR